MCQSVHLVASRNLRSFANQGCPPAQDALEQDLTAALRNHECEVRRARPILAAKRHGFIESRAVDTKCGNHHCGLRSFARSRHSSDINRKHARQSGSNRTFMRFDDSPTPAMASLDQAAIATL
jgi:hypothetical protein